MNQRTRTPLVIGIVVAIVVIVAVTVLLATGGDDDAETSSTTVAPGATPSTPADASAGDGGESTTTIPEVLVGEVFPVTVDGTPLPLFESPDDDPAVGATPPTLTGQDFDGEQVVIGPGEASPTLVVFLAHWCPHCNAEVPRLIELHDDGRIPENLRVVAVSTGVAPDRPNVPPSEWLVDMGWPDEVMADGSDFARGVFVGADAYGLSSFPYTVMIGSDGTVVDRWAGESGVDELAERIAAGAAA